MSGKIISKGEFNHWLGPNGDLQHSSYFITSDKGLWVAMPGIDQGCTALKVQGLTGR